MDVQRGGYDELYAYAMTRGRDRFVLQHVVDAGAAQCADADAKPIKIVFALIGLYLRVEHGFSGRQVQDVHVRLARRKRPWPLISIPDARGDMTPDDVLVAAPGDARDAAIGAWCMSVWHAYAAVNRAAIETLLRHSAVID